MEYAKLFSPITINRVQISNRIVMPAMGLGYTDDYSFNERYRAFYRERARGGAGLMIVGPTAIDKPGSAPAMPALFDDSYIEPFKDFIDELHRETDVSVGTQLFHMGRYSYSFFWGIEPIAPSAVPCKLTGQTPREMTEEDIQGVLDAFRQGARRAAEADFDYIEAVGCTGYLISQFLSPVTNRRQDRWGGDLSGRMKFGLEVIRAMRAGAGPDKAVGIRVAGNDFMEGGHTNVESAAFCVEAEKAGADAINVTGGWHETNVPQLTTNVPPGVYTYLARGIKEKVGLPVFASNRLGDPDVAERTLRSGAADMICWGRPLIADPELPLKVREGRFDEITWCIACNQGCFDSIFSGAQVHCVLNPRAGREEETVIRKAAQPRRIMVIGGGPAGMEFAATAARRGHKVVLYEKEPEPGGQVKLAKMPPGKAELQNMIDSLINRMERWGVEYRPGREADLHTVEAENPDLVVLASGARPADFKVPGWDLGRVVTAWDVLAEKVPDIGRDVVVVGGSATGCEAAHFIAGMGTLDPEAFTFLMYHNAEDVQTVRRLLHDPPRRITVIDVVDRLAGAVGKTSRWSLLKSLRLCGVDLRPRTSLLEITEKEVVVETDGGKETIPADTVVIAAGAVSNNELAGEIEEAGFEAAVIGDAKSPRRITEAVHEGFNAALQA